MGRITELPLQHQGGASALIRTLLGPEKLGTDHQGLTAGAFTPHQQISGKGPWRHRSCGHPNPLTQLPRMQS